MFTRLAVLLILMGAFFSLSQPSFALAESDQDTAISALQDTVKSLQSDVSTLKTDVAALQSTVSSQAATIAAQRKIIDDQKNLLSHFMQASDTARTNGGTSASKTQTPQNTILLRGEDLLYYIYKKNIADHPEAIARDGGSVILYREIKGPYAGAIYYRRNDATHTPVWVTVPAEGAQVAASLVKRYAPDYRNYSQKAPPVPPEATTVPVTQSITSF